MTVSLSPDSRPPAFVFGIISFMWARPFTREYYDSLTRASELGFEAFELVMPEPGNVDFAELGDLCSRHGLRSALTARVGAETDPCHPRAEVRKRAGEYLRECIDAAATMGAEVVGGPLLGSPLVFAGQRPRLVSDAERRRRFDLCVRHLAEAASYAAERGVRLALEPVNRFETDVVNLVEQALELLSEVDGGDTVGILVDTFHANIEERSVPAAIRMAGENLLHLHANENHRGMPGTGHLPWPEILAALHETGFRGQVILEPFRRNDNSFGVPLASWRPPDLPTEEAMLEDALRYLRDLAETPAP